MSIGYCRFYPLLTMLIGFVSFLITGILVGLMSLEINEGMILLLGLPIGSLLMLFMFHKLERDKILVVIIRSVLGGFVGFLAGFIIGELLAGIIGFFIPSLKNLEQNLLFILISFGTTTGLSVGWYSCLKKKKES